MEVLVLGYGHAGKAYIAALERVAPNCKIFVTDIGPDVFVPERYLSPGRRKPEKFDLVIIATPPNSHLEGVQQTLELSDLIIVEKPIAIDPAEHTEILNLAAHRKNIYFSFHASFGQEFELLSDRISLMEFESLRLSHLFCDPYSGLNKQHLGGPFWDSIYNVVSVFLSIVVEPIEIENISILIDEKEKFIASVEYSFASTPRSINQFIEINWSTPFNLKISQLETSDACFHINHSSQAVTRCDGLEHSSLPFKHGRLIDHYSGVVKDALTNGCSDCHLAFANRISDVVFAISAERHGSKH